MPPHPPVAAPPRIPDFDLLRVIGRGSYGEVWLARSVTGAWRAVKVVQRRHFDSARPYEREFEGIRKFEPISRSTEGLVHLLHISRGEDFFYYVMELADAVKATAQLSAVEPGHGTGALPLPQDCKPAFGADTYSPRTLATDLQQRGRLPFADCLRTALVLARGLEHLHASGLIHRDIKPSNIIFVNGAPRLADIGLVTDADASRTFVGTQGYLPPDGGGTAAADLYSLGKVLYEMSTGLDRQEFPVMPADFAHWPERAPLLELSEVFERACASDPTQRYTKAAALREDLELLHAGQSVVRQHRYRWWRRRLSSAAMLTLVAALFVSGGWYWRQRTQPNPPAVTRDASANAKAVHAYRQGRAAIERRTRRDFTNALVHFDEALRLDRSFALAQAGRAEALIFLASYDPSRAGSMWEQGKAAAETALRQIPDLSSAHFTLGLFEMNREWNWARAEAHLRRGLEGEPSSSEGYQRLAGVLGARGQCTEAVAAARQAVALEPNSRGANYSLGLQLYHARNYEAAVAQLRRTLTLTPDFAAARLLLARVLFQLDRAPEGIAERLALMDSSSRTNPMARHLSVATDQFGPAGFWRKRLEQLQNAGPFFELTRAEAHVRLGDYPAAVKCLENAAALREPSAIYLGVDPLHDPLRTNASFIALATRLGLSATVAEAGASIPSALLTEAERSAGLSAAEKAAGFRLIFDGVSLQGWRSDQTNWAVVEGALQCADAKSGKPSPLRYFAETVPENFELRFQWRVATNGQSGVNYRPGLVAYQVIDNAHSNAVHSATARAGSLRACLGATDSKAAHPVGAWNEGRIIAQATTIEHWLNGRLQLRLDYQLPRFTNHLAALDAYEHQQINTSFGNVRARGGYLSLLDEGPPGAAFRHVRWRRLE